MNNRVLINFHQNCFEQEVVQDVLRYVDLLMLFGIWEEMPHQRKESSTVPVIIIKAYHYYQLHKNFTQYSSFKVNPYVADIIGIIRVSFNVIHQILCICQLLENRWEYSGAVHQLFTVFENA